jgi:hypothetical protein
VAAVFTGNAEAFNWTNDNPAIGLPASGTGNIAFTSVKAPQTETAQITVTPANAACDGDPVTFTITVQGSNMDPPPDITVCDGDAVSIPFSGNASEYDWTSSNPAIGLDAAGSGAIAFTAQGGSSPLSSVVTVTPQPCPFASRSFTITVRPKAAALPLPDTVLCIGDSLSLPLLGATPGTTFEWTNTNGAIGLDTAGNVPYIRFTAAAVDSFATGLITVIPTRQGCVGQPMRFRITVRKCCVTAAGTLDTAARVVCGPNQLIALTLPGNHTLGPEDSLRFILYSNPANPLGSIVQYTDTLLFAFLPDSMQLDSAYYAGVLAGPLLPGDSLRLDTAANCFSLYRGPLLRWLRLPAMTLGAAPPEAVCKAGCANLLFEFTGAPPFEFVWEVWHNGQALISRQETSAGYQRLVSVCPVDFDVPLPPGSGMYDVRVVWLADGRCGCE